MTHGLSILIGPAARHFIHVGILHLFLKQIYKALVCLSAQYTVVPLIPLKGLGEGVAIPVGVDEGLGLHVGLHVGHLHRHLVISALSSSTSLGSSSTLCALDRHLVGRFVSLHVDWDYPERRRSEKGFVSF